MLVTEYMPNGDLFTALGRSPHRYSWYALGRGIALDIARGLAFLHARNIVHFDLKSANILLDKHNRAKLADMGLAKLLTQDHGSDSLCTFLSSGTHSHHMAGLHQEDRSVGKTFALWRGKLPWLAMSWASFDWCNWV